MPQPQIHPARPRPQAPDPSPTPRPPDRPAVSSHPGHYARPTDTHAPSPGPPGPSPATSTQPKPHPEGTRPDRLSPGARPEALAPGLCARLLGRPSARATGPRLPSGALCAWLPGGVADRGSRPPPHTRTLGQCPASARPASPLPCCPGALLPCHCGRLAAAHPARPGRARPRTPGRCPHTPRPGPVRARTREGPARSAPARAEAPPGGWCRAGPRALRAQSSYASSGGQEQTRFRSPNAWSMRRTGGQYLSAAETPAGKTASSRL